MDSALFRAIVRAFAFLLYSVLATFEPLVRVILFLLAVLGFLTCIVYRVLLRDPQFPFWSLLFFTVSMCALWGLYALILRGLYRE